MRHAAIVKDDFGMTIQGECNHDLSAYDAVYLRFRKPGSLVWEEIEGVKRAGAVGNSIVEYDPTEVDALFDTLGEVKVGARAESGGMSIKSKKSAKIMVVLDGEL